VGQRWTTPTGWTVELSDSDGHPVYRVTGWDGLYVAVCYTVDELEEFLTRQGVSLADLTETDG
jgi:hypothetical protein